VGTASSNGASASNGGSPRPFTVADINPPTEARGNLGRIPPVVLGALRLVFQASRRNAITGFVVQLAAAAATGLQLLITKAVLQDLGGVARGDSSLASLLPEFGLLVAATALIGAMMAVAAHQQNLLAELVTRHTYDRIVGVSSAVEMDAFETPAFYDKLQRARTSGTFRPIEMVSNVGTLTSGVLTCAGVSVALFTIEPLLVPLIGLAGVPLLLATLKSSRAAYLFEYHLTPQGRERNYLIELLTQHQSAKEVRVFDAGPFLRKRFDALNDERIERLREFLRYRLIISLVGTAATAAGIAIALGALGWLLASGRVDLAGAVTAGMGIQLLSTRMNQITTSVGKLVETGMFLDDYNAFLELGEDQLRISAAIPPRIKNGDRPPPFTGVAVENVSFSYPSTERRVLDDVSMQVDPGEVVALVGGNGSGKTTLVKLICQLHDPAEGRIVWNGTDTDTLAPQDVHADMTVIFQDFIQYHLSAADNIALGRVERPPEMKALAEAARQAGAHDFLSQLPEGYGTRLGRQFYGGLELSVGQWQRLALSRAFFRGGNFLVLDEPTAALDPRAEHELFSQMRTLSQGRSVLLVSHRFSSVRSADRIYVLDGGRITESGSHEELVELGGHYAELYKLQEAAFLGARAEV
jgi:ATP-binding cassette subfamily B protein